MAPLLTLSAGDFEASIATLFKNIDLDGATIRPLDEPVFDKVRDLLAGVGKSEWSKRPRTYTVLRLINRVDVMDSFVLQGFLDMQFPYLESQLPQTLSASSRTRFMQAQRVTLSDVKDAEFTSRHVHLKADANDCFFIIKQLGGGSFGVVDHVRSKLSLEDYARKRIARAKTFSRDKAQMKIFVNELKNLKRLRHEHLVRLVGSYTDPRHIGLLMEPIADCDLKQFLSQTPFPPGNLSVLRRSLGCLVSAVCYLHDNKCRHKDLKPGNILVKGDKLLITDFGTARDWSDRTRGTTVGPSGPYTPAYAAPEVASQDSRGNPADIWSLGCIFVDIVTILKGETLDSRRDFYGDNGNGLVSPCNNFEGFQLWVQKLHDLNREDNQPLEWVQSMVLEAPRQRVTASELFNRIIAFESEQYYGDCCDDHDSTDAGSLIESEYEEEGTAIPFRHHASQPISPVPASGAVNLPSKEVSNVSISNTVDVNYRKSKAASVEDVDETSKPKLSTTNSKDGDSKMTTETGRESLTRSSHSTVLRKSDKIMSAKRGYPKAAYVEDVDETILPKQNEKGDFLLQEIHQTRGVPLDQSRDDPFTQEQHRAKESEQLFPHNSHEKPNGSIVEKKTESKASFEPPNDFDLEEGDDDSDNIQATFDTKRTASDSKVGPSKSESEDSNGAVWSGWSSAKTKRELPKESKEKKQERQKNEGRVKAEHVNTTALSQPNQVHAKSIPAAMPLLPRDEVPRVYQPGLDGFIVPSWGSLSVPKKKATSNNNNPKSSRIPRGRVQRASSVNSGILQGLPVQKDGKIVNALGEEVGELVDADLDLLKICLRRRYLCNAEGNFLDRKGNVFARARVTAHIRDPPRLRPSHLDVRDDNGEYPRRYAQRNSRRSSYTSEDESLPEQYNTSQTTILPALDREKRKSAKAQRARSPEYITIRTLPPRENYDDRKVDRIAQDGSVDLDDPWHRTHLLDDKHQSSHDDLASYRLLKTRSLRPFLPPDMRYEIDEDMASDTDSNDTEPEPEWVTSTRKREYNLGQIQVPPRPPSATSAKTPRVKLYGEEARGNLPGRSEPTTSFPDDNISYSKRYDIADVSYGQRRPPKKDNLEGKRGKPSFPRSATYAY